MPRKGEKKGETLKDIAEREAAEAEAEVKSEPGEQGVATQDDAQPEKKKDPPKIWDRAPSQEEIAKSDVVLQELEDRAQDMGPAACIDSLLAVVDVHPGMKVPATWPAGAQETLTKADLAERIGKLMLRACPKLEVSPMRVVFLWRNKKTWTKKGEPVRAEAKKLSELSRHFSRGAVAAVVCNYQLFRVLNTRQKLAAIYHALRQLDAEGSIRPPQFSGFFDELELFGTGTHSTDAFLVRAIEAGAQRELPFEESASALEEPGEGGEEKAAA